MSFLHAINQVDHGGSTSASTLNTLTTLAVRLSAVTAMVEEHKAHQASIEKALNYLAVQFDRACAAAAAEGIPLNTEFNTVDETGRPYVMWLTEEGVQYRVA